MTTLSTCERGQAHALPSSFRMRNEACLSVVRQRPDAGHHAVLLFSPRLQPAHNLDSLSSRAPGICEFKRIFCRRALVSSQFPDLHGQSRLRSEGSIHQSWGLHDEAYAVLCTQRGEFIRFLRIEYVVYHAPNSPSSSCDIYDDLDLLAGLEGAYITPFLTIMPLFSTRDLACSALSAEIIQTLFAASHRAPNAFSASFTGKVFPLIATMS